MGRPLGACKALALAQRLNDLELLTLKGSQHVRKRGAAMRVFGARDLRMPSLVKAHAAAGATVEQSLAGLVRKGMLESAGRRASLQRLTGTR